jgi:hypothetical protein
MLTSSVYSIKVDYVIISRNRRIGMAPAEDKLIPAYISFSTFAGLAERFKNTAIPHQIDNSVLPKVAGGVRGQIRSTLRFLKLADAEHQVNTTFRDLVQSHGTESWKAKLGAIIDDAYGPILNGLDLTGATPSQLSGKFKAVGMSGQMCEKAVRFLLAALDSAGRTFSPHLKVRGSQSAPKPPRRTKPRTETAPREGEREEEIEGAIPPAAGNTPGTKVRSFTFPIPGEPDIRVIVPEGLDDADTWAMVNVTLQTYIKLNQKAKGRKVGTEGSGK